MDALTPTPTLNREERLLDLGAEIRKKEAAASQLQEEITYLRREFEQLLLPNVKPVSQPMSREVAVKVNNAALESIRSVNSSTSLPKRILSQMQASPGKEFTSEDFAHLADTDSMLSIRTSLVRLCDRDNKIERIDRGVYRLARNNIQTEIKIASSAK